MIKPSGRLLLVSFPHCFASTSSLSKAEYSTALLIRRSGLGELILGRASCLDAFSIYLFQTSLPSGAAGATARTQEVCSSRSSRTRDNSLQFSCAHTR